MASKKSTVAITLTGTERMQALVNDVVRTHRAYQAALKRLQRHRLGMKVGRAKS